MIIIDLTNMALAVKMVSGNSRTGMLKVSDRRNGNCVILGRSSRMYRGFISRAMTATEAESCFPRSRSLAVALALSVLLVNVVPIIVITLPIG